MRDRARRSIRIARRRSLGRVGRDLEVRRVVRLLSSGRRASCKSTSRIETLSIHQEAPCDNVLSPQLEHHPHRRHQLLTIPKRPRSRPCPSPQRWRAQLARIRVFRYTGYQPETHLRLSHHYGLSGRAGRCVGHCG